MEAFKIVSKTTENGQISILLKNEDYLHFSIMETSEKDNFSDSLYKSPNKIRINIRNQSLENFRYVGIIHSILKKIGLINVQFTLQIFSKVDDLKILEAFLFLINLYFQHSLNIELNDDKILIKNKEEALFQFII